MRLRTVAKLGVVLSVVLFCIAVGFMDLRLSMTDRGREFNLFSLVPSNSIGVLEAIISIIFKWFSTTIIAMNWEIFSFWFIQFYSWGLNEYATPESTWPEQSDEPFIGSFHARGSPRDQGCIFPHGAGDEKLLADISKSVFRVSFSRRKKI